MSSISTLPTTSIHAGTLLLHISREIYRGLPLHFGRNGSKRYDDPAKNFGVLYLAFDFATALIHDHQWSRSRRAITVSEANKRLVRVVGVMQELKVVDLTARDVMAAALGLNLSQLSSRRYHYTQRISALVHAFSLANEACVDGLIFPSRNNYPAVGIALFSDAMPKIELSADITLTKHTGWPAFLARYGVQVLPR